MTVSTPAHQLFALTAAGPVPLAVPPGLVDPGRVYDDLPRGVYEAARTFEHYLFVGLAEHLDRMQRSLGLAGLPEHFDRAGLCAALDAIARGFPGQDSKLRFDVLAGPAESLGSQARVLVQATGLALPPPEAYRDGVPAQLSRLQRAHPALKDAQWVVDRRAAAGGTPDNFESILVDDQGRLLEGTMSNLFWVRGGVLRTAPVEGVLPGVTRGFVLRLADDLGLEAREEAAREDALGGVEEAFFTTSVRSVVPVVRIAGQALGDGRPGPVTRRLMEAYASFCARVARPAVDA